MVLSRLRRGWVLPSALTLFLLAMHCFADDKSPGNKDLSRPSQSVESDWDTLNSQSRPEVRQVQATVDAGEIAAGQAAFESACTLCHDAERSLQKSKSLAGWRSTVRRMAEKDGADVPRQSWEAIALYLASLSGNSAAGGDANEPASDPFTLMATLSPTWRGGGSDNIQNQGFLPDVWVGVNWQPANLPISARVTACVSCHTEPGEGNRIEFVEAALRLDIIAATDNCECERRLSSGIEAGRFIVPFGNFSSQSNPGVYRTVSKPLMYNMGLRVYDEDLGDPVLPMPFADDGLKWDSVFELGGDWTTTFDLYAVNGLQGAEDGIDFDASREYVDNNRSPSVGTRWTIGNQDIRLGASYIEGQFNESGGGPFAQRMQYQIFGADLSGRVGERLRYVVEYAQRDSDRLVFLPGQLSTTEKTDGLYAQAEYLLVPAYKISLIGRYDWQRKQSVLPPAGSSLTVSDFSVQRLTYGVNLNLPGGSLLMLNHEHWFLGNGLNDIDVLGVRWALSF